MSDHVDYLMEKIRHDELKRAVRRMLRALDGMNGAGFGALPNRIAARWSYAWGDAFEEYRKQVEDLIA